MKPELKTTIEVQGVPFTFEQVFSVVDTFYQRIQIDEILKVPFQSVHDWPEHIDRITHFWWIRLGGTPYLFTTYNPVQKHFEAGFNKELLERWLSIFKSVQEEKLNQQQVAVWSFIAERIGQGLTIRNDMLRETK